MLTAILKAVKMLLSCCPKNSQDAAVLAALKSVQDAEKNHPTKTKYRDLFPSVIAHEGDYLKTHSKISHGVHYPKNLRAAATYSALVVDCATEDCFREDQQMREDPRK
jgi:protein involved in temperature-dependent protein secretion